MGGLAALGAAYADADDDVMEGGVGGGAPKGKKVPFSGVGRGEEKK